MAEAGTTFYKERMVFPPGTHCRQSHSSSLTELPNGDLMVAYWCGTEEGAPDAAIAASRLRAGSESWDPPLIIADTPGRFDGNPVLYTWRSGRVWLLYSVRDPEAPGMVQIMESHSEDGGETWSTPGAFVTERGIRTRNHPVEIGGGEVLLPLFDHISAQSLMLITGDMGRNWWRSDRIISGDGGVQPAVVLREDGSLYALMRSWSEDPERRFLLQSESRDRGRTWTTPTLSRVPSVSSAVDMIRLRSGRLVLAYNNGIGRQRAPLNLALSADGGRTWSFDRVLESGSGPFSYPSLVQSIDGRIHVTFTYMRETIKHVEVNEDWIMKVQPSRESGDPLISGHLGKE